MATISSNPDKNSITTEICASTKQKIMTHAAIPKSIESSALSFFMNVASIAATTPMIPILKMLLASYPSKNKVSMV